MLPDPIEESLEHSFAVKDNDDIQRLIELLQSKDGVERQHARRALVRKGTSAIPSLIELLSSPKEHLRWEACKALGSIRDPNTAEHLVKALRDDSMEVRWLAAEGLVALGENALVTLLEALEVHFDSVYLLEGAHHALHALERQNLLNQETLMVLDALRYLEPKITVGVAAARALESLTARHWRLP